MKRTNFFLYFSEQFYNNFLIKMQPVFDFIKNKIGKNVDKMEYWAQCYKTFYDRNLRNFEIS